MYLQVAYSVNDTTSLMPFMREMACISDLQQNWANFRDRHLIVTKNFVTGSLLSYGTPLSDYVSSKFKGAMQEE